MIENRHGLVGATKLLPCSDTAAWAAEFRGERLPSKGRVTLGADKGYDTREFVKKMRQKKVTPHVAQNHKRPGGSAIEGERPVTPDTEYRFISPIRNHREIPADFLIAVKSPAFNTGVFLLQSEPNWFQQSSPCPARLLRLAGRLLHTVPHPLSDEELSSLPLDNLLQLETGTALLRGWLKFTTAQRTFGWQYNARASQLMEAFLRELKRRWVSPKNSSPILCSQIYGEKLDIKFLSELQNEVCGEEQIIRQYFVPLRKFEYKWVCFRREASTVGHLLVVTTASRLVWVTDQYGSYRELYAGTVRRAPLSALSGIGLMQEKGQLFLQLNFTFSPWRLPIKGGAEIGPLLRNSLRQLAAGQWQESTEDPLNVLSFDSSAESLTIPPESPSSHSTIR